MHQYSVHFELNPTRRMRLNNFQTHSHSNIERPVLATTITLHKENKKYKNREQQQYSIVRRLLKNKIQWADSALIELSSTGVAVAVQWSTKRFTTVKLKVRIPRRAFFITPLKNLALLGGESVPKLKAQVPKRRTIKVLSGLNGLKKSGQMFC